MPDWRGKRWARKLPKKKPSWLRDFFWEFWLFFGGGGNGLETKKCVPRAPYTPISAVWADMEATFAGALFIAAISSRCDLGTRFGHLRAGALLWALTALSLFEDVVAALFQAARPPKWPHENLFSTFECHYAQNYYRTELIIFELFSVIPVLGNSRSTITEPNCFWNYLVTARSVSRGLPNPLPNGFGIYVR